MEPLDKFLILKVFLILLICRNRFCRIDEFKVRMCKFQPFMHGFLCNKKRAEALKKDLSKDKYIYIFVGCIVSKILRETGSVYTSYPWCGGDYVYEKNISRSV